MNVLAEVRRALARNRDRKIALDTETGQLDRPWEAEVFGISLACDDGCWWLPVKSLNGKPALPADAVRDLLRPILADPKWTLVMQNAPYDLNVLWGFGLTKQRAEVHDLIWMAWALDENRKGRYGLKDQTFDEFGQRQTRWEDSELGGGKIPADQYAREDAHWTWALYGIYWSRLDEDLRNYLDWLASPTARITASMMRNGIGVDIRFLLQHKEHLDNETARLESKLRSIAPHVDPNSPKQLSTYLFSRSGAGLKPFGKCGKSGQFSTDYESLQELVGHPYTDTLLEFRDIEKQLTTYVIPALARAGQDPQQRLHTNLQIAGTTSGRFASSQPNLQNLPREGVIKKAFRAKSGFAFVCGDFDQLELRLMAHRSQDPVMLKTYREGGDIHTVTAEAVGCKRFVAKQLNFGIQYGGSAETVERILRVKAGVRVTMQEAQAFRDGWNGLYCGVVSYRQKIRQEFDRNGFVRTLLGRYRRVRAKARPGSEDTGFGYRQALNATIQASAADLILMVMRNMQREIDARAVKDKRWGQVEQLIQVHDELLLEAPRAIAREVKKVLEGVFVEIGKLLNLTVPLSGKVGIGGTWAAAKA